VKNQKIITLSVTTIDPPTFGIGKWNHLGGVMISVLVSNEVECRFNPRPGEAKNYEIGFCSFSTKHAASRSKMKD
jgi:hypothetical protein